MRGTRSAQQGTVGTRARATLSLWRGHLSAPQKSLVETVRVCQASVHALECRDECGRAPRGWGGAKPACSPHGDGLDPPPSVTERLDWEVH